MRSLLGDATESPEIDGLSRRMQEVFFPKGSFLYRAGDAPHNLSFIVSGVVAQGDEGLTRFLTGDALGFVDGLLDRPHALDALVEEDAVVLQLPLDDWIDFMDDNFDFMRRNLLRRTQEMPPRTLGFPPLFPEGLPVPEDGDLSGRLVNRLAVLHACPALQRAGIQAIAQLSRLAELRTLARDEQIEAQESLGLWVVLSGHATARLRTESAETEVSGGPGTLVTGLTVINAPLPYLTLTNSSAEGPTELLHLPRDSLFDVMEDHFDVARSLMAFIAVQVEHYNKSGAPKFRQLDGADIHGA